VGKRQVQFGVLFGHHDEDERDGVLGALAMVIVAPLSATLSHFAVSRSREYAADATGAGRCGDPIALASALRKVERVDPRGG
jgi:heat shock protein HtpX